MRSLLARLGLQPQGPAPEADPFLRALQEHLDRLGADRLEYLAGFAGQLARVASAQDGISPSEAAVIAEQLAAHGGVARDEADLVVALLREQFEVLRNVQNHLLNRAVNAHASAADKETLVECLYAVAAADRLVSDVEDAEIRRIADALLISHGQLMAIRGRYRDRLEVLQKLKRDTGRE